MEEIVTLRHIALETPLILSSEYVQLLIVEAPQEFYRFVYALDAQIGGGEGEFFFLRDDKPVSAEKEGGIIADLFHFDLNDKRGLNALTKRLAETCRYGELQYHFSEIGANAQKFLYELFDELPFALTIDELTIEDLLKCANVRFEKTYDSLLEKIVCYINAMVELRRCRFFVFVNLKSVLSDEDLHALYHHCAMEKIGLLLLESGKLRPLLPEEKAVIVTEDLCEILENYEGT